MHDIGDETLRTSIENLQQCHSSFCTEVVRELEDRYTTKTNKGGKGKNRKKDT